MRKATYNLLSIAVALVCLSEPLLAQRGGRGGGGGGRGGGFGGGFGGGGMASRGGARSSVTFPAGGGNFGGNVNRGYINQGDINRGDINRGDIYVNRPINVGDVDRNGGYYNRGDGCCYRPVARAAAFTTAAALTAAAIGSVSYALPPSCTAVVVGGVTYEQCGSTWYRPQFAGTTTTYVVVGAPQ